VRIKTDFPRAVREVEHVWIPLSDGCRLAARMWLPDDADSDPVPAIVEYIPYRKNDATASRDAPMHAYFAGHGYASVRVDMRGSGDSDGLLLDEYLPQEQDDGVEVIGWLAEQPWCTGAVGMIGKSWGGFNGLQIAARRPPPLKAIVTVCSTDDRYSDDVHYMGGCLLGAWMLPWASVMLAYSARPPDPKIVGERWRETWRERMERTPPFIERWLAHQRRDAYWKHGSVCEDYGAIECAVYAVGGWADAYSDAIPRLLARLPGPRKGLIGPWGHLYPHDGVPGPAIGFLQECVRWWDQWLKGIDTGVMDEPMLRAWMQESVPPKTAYVERPGRWVAEESWPSPRIEVRTVSLVFPREEVRGSQAAGLGGGDWCGFGHPGELPPDQRAEDGLSLCFTSEPLGERLEILGFPDVVLELAADRPTALVAVRLCDVAPDGASLLVTRNVLNLTHRNGHEAPAPLVPGERLAVTVRLHGIAHAFSLGHRIRVAVSPTYWPQAWPSPQPVTLTIFGGRLELPVRPPRPGDDALSPFGPPESAAPRAIEVVAPAAPGRRLSRDVGSGRHELVVDQDFWGARRLPDGLVYSERGRDTFAIVEDDPLSASVRCEWRIDVGRGEWQTRIETASAMSADEEAFLVTNVLDAYEGNARVFTKTSTAAIPRDLV